MVSRTGRSSNRPLMNLSRAFLPLIVFANLYVIISSGVIRLNLHFLSMSTSLFQFSSSVSASSCFTVKNWARLWNTFRASMNVFLNSFNNSCRLTSFSSRPHCSPKISYFAFGPRAQMTSLFMWYIVWASMPSIPWPIKSSKFL